MAVVAKSAKPSPCKPAPEKARGPDARARHPDRAGAVVRLALFPDAEQHLQPARPVGRHRHRGGRHDLRHPDRRHRPSVGSVAGLTGVILGLALQKFRLPVSILIAVVAGGGDRALLRRADRLFRSGGLRRDARRHGDRPQPRLHPLRPDGDLDDPLGPAEHRLHRRARHPDQRALPRRALSRRLALPDPHQGRPHDLRRRLEQGGGAGGGAERALLQHPPLCRVRRARRRRGDVLDRPDPVGRPADRERPWSSTPSPRW